MTEQPDAIRLAEGLDAVPDTGADPDLVQQSAAELRRLHKENVQMSARVAELEANLKRSTSAMADMESQLEAIGAGGVEPLIAPGSNISRITQEQADVLGRARMTAATAAQSAKIPEFGSFVSIVQDLNWLCERVYVQEEA